MKIAVWHDLPSGGGMRALAGQLRELHRRGHDVCVWTPHSFSEPQHFDWMPPEVPVRIDAFPDVPAESRLDARIGAPLDMTRSRARVLDEHARKVTRDMQEWGAQLLLAHPCWWFFTSPLALHWQGASLLYLQEPNRNIHEARPDNVWGTVSTPYRDRLRSRIGAMVRDRRRISNYRVLVQHEVEWARAYDRVLVNSLYSRESVIRAYGIDATFCPLGVGDGSMPDSDVPDKQPFVVSVGELADRKGTKLAIEAVATIEQSRRPAFWWYGNRANVHFQREVTALAQRLGVDFRFVHAAPDAEVTAAMSRAACFLFCAELEPLGLAPLEANLAGSAVVAIAEGGVRETIIDGVNGTLVANRDPAAIGAAIERYVTDLEYAREVGARARTHAAKHHNWALAGDALERQLRATSAVAARS